MPGGSVQSYESLGPIFEKIAAQVDGVPCCTHVGPDGAGHFIKMVHNGIEYADMQLIAEAYDLLKQALGLSAAEIGEIVAEWNSGDLESFLIEVTAEVLAHKDNVTGQAFVDIILDQAEQKGTGRWTVQNALDLGVPVTGIAEATFARALSGSVPQREAGAAALPGDRKITRLNSSHVANSYAVFCLKKKNVFLLDNGFCKFLKVYKGKTFGWGFFLIGYFNGVFEDFLRVLIRKIGLCLAFYEIVFFL